MANEPTSEMAKSEPIASAQRMDPRPLEDASTVAYDMVTSSDVSAVESPRIRRLSAYWAGRGKGDTPARSDIDPADMGDLLPNLMMIDIVGRPARFRYRLVGARVAQFTGFDFTGRCIDEMVFQGRDFMEQCYRCMVAERRPIFGHYAWLVRSHHFGQCEFGLFPLSDDGRTVNRALSIEDYDRMERDILAIGQLRQGH